MLWFWCRPAATAPNGPLAWEPPYASGEALKKPKKKKKEKKRNWAHMPKGDAGAFPGEWYLV